MKGFSLLTFAALVLLTGCVTNAPKPAEVITVKVAVKVPCIDKAPTKPVNQFARGPMPIEGERARLLIRDFEAQESYGQAWEAAAAGCLK